MARGGEITGAGRFPGDEGLRAQRRAALKGALVATTVLVGIAALRQQLDLWLALAALVGIVASALLVAERDGPRPSVGRAVTGEKRPAVADALLANIPDPVILVDRREIVLEMNEAARQLLPALKARHPLSFALRAPDVLDGIDEVLRTGETLRVEYAERVPTERVFEVQIGALRRGPAAPADDPDAAVLLFFRDLTSARRLEHMRVDFVANASHELRTPLASLLGFIDTLQGPARNDPAARERFLAIMGEQGRRMARLVDDLLQLSRIELRAHVPPETPVDLAAVVRHMIDALQPLARDRGVAITLEAPPDPLVILGDRDELLRVVENLVENAVKYGEAGGRVEVTLARQPAAGAHPSQAVLSVRDFGPGIAPEHLPRLTERFYRADVATSRDKGGTGLGLAIVKHIVARHRGRLGIESETGQGACFRIQFPELVGPAAT